MPVKKYHIKLEAPEREALEAITRSQHAARIKVQRAQALLAVDCGESGPGLPDVKAREQSGLSLRSLERLRQRASEVGALGALERKPRLTPPVEGKVTGEVEAAMVQIACSPVPRDASRWTMRLIAERLVELEVVESISSEAVRTTLKKMNLNPGSSSAGASRPTRTPRS